jgi:hypothetical protein
MWTQDLMKPTFLKKIAGPATYSSVTDLMCLWRIKARLAQGRPFGIEADLNNISTDTMLKFTFGDNFQHSAQRVQIEHISRLGPSGLSTGGHAESVEFPEAPVDTYITATHKGTDYVEKAVNSWISQLTMWWLT